MAGSKILVGTTEAGKEIYALAVHNRSLIKLQLGSGGVLPSVLRGAFSNMTDAQVAVNKYLNKEDRPVPVPSSRILPFLFVATKVLNKDPIW